MGVYVVVPGLAPSAIVYLILVDVFKALPSKLAARMLRKSQTGRLAYKNDTQLSRYAQVFINLAKEMVGTKEKLIKLLL